MDQRKTNPGRMSILFFAVREALTLAIPPMRAISVPVAGKYLLVGAVPGFSGTIET